MRNSNTKSDTYCDRDCHRHSDSHGCSYGHSHADTYFDTATNAHTQNRTDAKNSSHPAAAASLSLVSACSPSHIWPVLAALAVKNFHEGSLRRDTATSTRDVYASRKRRGPAIGKIPAAILIPEQVPR